MNDSPNEGRLPPERSGRARAALYLLAVVALAVVGVVSIDEIQSPKTKPASPQRASIAAARPVRSPARAAAKLTLPATRDAELRDEQLRDAVRDEPLRKAVREEPLRDAVGDFRVLEPGDNKPGKNTTIIASTESASAPATGGRPRWSGAYFGVNAGGAAGVSSLRTSIAPQTGVYFLAPDIAQINDIGPLSATPNGFVGGLQAGYNHQSGALVYGLEADINALPIDDTQQVTAAYNSNPTTSFTLSQSIRTDWLVTVRPRLGVAIDDLLLYGTAGVALTRFKYTEQFTDTFNPAFASESFSETRLGWTVGAGAEYALREHWTIKGEYLYADFGKMSESSNLAIPINRNDQFNHSATFNVHLVRLGLNYKF